MNSTRSNIPFLIAELAQAGAGITAVVPFVPTLEDLYFAVQQKRAIRPATSLPACDTRRPARAKRSAVVRPNHPLTHHSYE
ncbi:MAG: hypothetical protein R2706_13050 [Acidimicrobiales bacterium]